MYKCKHFKIEELVSQATLAYLGEEACWKLFDERALMMLDKLRETFGPATVNDWIFGGKHDSRGFRAPNDPDGARYSDHRFGRAFDVIFQKKSAKDVRAYIIAHKEDFPFITCIEDGVSWLHFSCRNTNRIEIITAK